MRTLGLDLSTQSLTAVVVDTEAGAVLAVESVRFGQDLPSYESPNGFLLGTGPAVRHANPLLWVDALDVLFARLRAGKLDLASISGVAVCAQQHGTVYLGRSFNDVRPWDARASLRAQVQPLLSRATAPLWMDTSTALECAEIASAAGGDASIVARTGSRMTPRFAAPQIRKFHKEAPEDYAATREIHLVSSFLTSLLIGHTAPLEPGDAAGMNLLELGSGQFSAELLAATAPELERRLPPVVSSQTIVGTLAPYFSQRYGFGADVAVLAGTGDNPASLVGMGATTEGSVVVSLGTSDTLFAPMSEPHTDPGDTGTSSGIRSAG
jgi:xylulokinase